jgi:hypothetical protein
MEGMSEVGPEHEWTPDDVTISRVEGGGGPVHGFVHGQLAVALHEGHWLILHKRSGAELGRFDRRYDAFDLATCFLDAGNLLTRDPHDENLRQRLEQIRGEWEQSKKS